MPNNGTINGSPGFGTAKFSNGMTSSGPSDSISIPGAVNTLMCANGVATYSYWVSCIDNGTYQNFFVLDGNNYSGMAAGGNLFFNAFGSGFYDSGINISSASFIHIEITHDGSEVLVFINGNQSLSPIMGAFVASSGPILVGNTNGSSPNLKLDEIAFWDTNLHAMGSSFTPPSSAYTGLETHLVALYHLETDANDSIGGGSVELDSTISGSNNLINLTDDILESLGIPFVQSTFSDSISLLDDIFTNLSTPSLEAILTDSIVLSDFISTFLHSPFAGQFDRSAVKNKVAQFFNNPEYYQEIDLDDSTQDGVDEIVAFTGSNYGTALIPFVKDLTYYDFLTLVPDLVGVVAIFNGASKQWMHPLSWRKFDRLRPDWETNYGTPEYFCPINHRYVAIMRKPGADNYGNMYILYRAQAPTLDDLTPIPMPKEYQQLVEAYVKTDLWEQNEEFTKASKEIQTYQQQLIKLHTLVHSRKQLDRPPSI